MTLHQDDDGPIQQVALVGRAQVDAAWVEPEGLPSFSDTLWRRFRFGVEMTFLGDWTAHVEADLDLNAAISDWYTQLTDAYLSWSACERVELVALKQSAGFTLDGATSSKKLLTLERNNLTHNLWFTEEYFTGLLAQGHWSGDGSYKAGVFSSDGDPEIGVDGASWFTLASLGYEFGNTKWRIDHVYQDEDPDANTRDFAQVLSLVAQWQHGRWGTWAEIAGGDGFSGQGQSDVWGVDVMPFYRISKRTEAVLRLTHLDSRDANGLRLNRYDDRVEAGRGNVYDEGYVGYNVYFYDHRFKWQTCATWARMDDDADDGGEYDGATLATGLRLSW
jgi:phosphate-selective porin OprO/OprP